MGVYNEWNKDTLYQSIHSILNQTYSNIEFIIYDDGSHEDVADNLRDIATTDERIILIGREKNHGLAFSLNACIEIAQGRYIARMDADDISHPNRLEEQYRFMERNPKYAWCGCNAILYDDNGNWGKRIYPENPTDKDYLKYSPFIHPTVIYRADILRECGGYLVCDETKRCEDYEIFMRLQQQGLRGYNIQQELFYYREDQNSFQRRTFKHRINEMKVRYDNFKKMKLLSPIGLIYVIRPVIGGLVPARLIAWIKKNESRDKKYNATRGTEDVSNSMVSNHSKLRQVDY